MTVIDSKAPPALQSFSPKGRGGPQYPAPGTRLGEGWAEAWRLLAEVESTSPGEYVYGGEVAKLAAEKAELHAVTMLNLMNRMVAGGILEADKRQVMGTRGYRQRNFYRIKR